MNGVKNVPYSTKNYTLYNRQMPGVTKCQNKFKDLIWRS